MKNQKNNNAIDYKKIFTFSAAEIREAIKSGKIRAERHGNLIYLSHDAAEMQMRTVIRLKTPEPEKHPYRRRKKPFLTRLVPSIFRKSK
jgi:hypothetical protein